MHGCKKPKIHPSEYLKNLGIWALILIFNNASILSICLWTLFTQFCIKSLRIDFSASFGHLPKHKYQIYSTYSTYYKSVLTYLSIQKHLVKMLYLFCLVLMNKVSLPYSYKGDVFGYNKLNKDDMSTISFCHIRSYQLFRPSY